MKADKKVWDWRTHILQEGPSNATYKHVLLTLSCYMNSAGRSCFPSISTLVDVTSLSKPTVIKYLKKAKEEGWIQVSKHGYGGQKWARNEYTADLPKAVKQINSLAKKAVNEVNKGGKPDSEGGKTDTKRRLNCLATNSSCNSPNNTSHISPDIYEAIYDSYPRKVKKEDALDEIKKALKNLKDDGETENPVKFLSKKTKLFAEANKDTPLKFIPYPENWFDQERYYENPKEWNVNGGSKDKKEKDELTFKSDCEFNLQCMLNEHETNFRERDEIKNPKVQKHAYKKVQEKLEKKYK